MSASSRRVEKRADEHDSLCREHHVELGLHVGSGEVLPQHVGLDVLRWRRLVGAVVVIELRDGWRAARRRAVVAIVVVVAPRLLVKAAELLVGVGIIQVCGMGQGYNP